MPHRPFASLRKTILIVLACAAVFAAALFLGRSFWNAEQTLKTAASHTTASAGLAVSIQTLSARSHGPFRRPLSAAQFRSVTEFGGDLYVAGRSSLMRYSTDGVLKQVWQVGAELPPFPLTKLTSRRATGNPELWIGTDGAGVLVFDGQNFRDIVPAAEAQRKISALLVLHDGRVVLGTQDAGVLIANGKRLDLLHSQLARTKVTALAGDEDALWIGTRDAGVWLWRSGEAVHFINELADPQVLAIATNGSRAWIGTPFGIAEFGNGVFKRPLAEGAFAQSLAEMNDTLWVGAVNQGIQQIPLATHALHPMLRPASLHAGADVLDFAHVGDKILAISPDAVSEASSGAPLIVPENPLTDSHISALQMDSRGRLWIGFFDRGLDIVEPASGKALAHFEDDLLFCINRIKEDRSTHTVGVATANGLALFDPSPHVRQTLARKQGLISDHVTDLLFEPSSTPGEIAFAAATPAGITFFNGGALSSISAFQGLVNNHVYTIAATDKHLLAGTLGGFSMLENRAVRGSYSTANSAIPQNWITASVTDGANFYLGTYGSGVIRIAPDGSINSYRDFTKHRIEINPNALLIADGFVYAGTAGQGLARLRIGESRWRFLRAGLPSLNVTALASANGALFVGTDNGLVQMAEQSREQ